MNRNFKIRSWDWLLVFALVLAPMTSLRIAKVGPAELLCAVWAVRHISFKSFKVDSIVCFLVSIFACMFLGTLICVLIAPDEASPTGLLTWVYLFFIACYLHRGIENNTLGYNEMLFNKACELSIWWYLLLYVYSLSISKSFLGIPMWYYNRFSGGATNPHQIALLLCVLVLWFGRQIIKGNKPFKSIIYMAAAWFLELETRSSTGLASFVLGLVTFAVIIPLTRVDSQKTKVYILVVEIFAGIGLVLLFANKIFDFVYDWIASDPNGLGRLDIWDSVSGLMWKSPVFGLGPGTHGTTGNNGVIELHNGYLEILAATGIVGFIVLVLLSAKTLKTIIRGDITLLPIMVGLYAYNVGGFAFRRLVFWLVFVFITVIAMQQDNKKPELPKKSK